MPWHYALCKRFHIPIDLCDSIFIGGGGNAGASAGVVAMGATVGLAAAAAFTWSANRPEASVRALGRIEVGQVVASAVAMVGFAVGGKTFWVYASALGLLLAAAARAYIPRARGPGGLADRAFRLSTGLAVAAGVVDLALVTGLWVMHSG